MADKYFDIPPEEEKKIIEGVRLWEIDGDLRHLDADPVFARIIARALTRQRAEAAIKAHGRRGIENAERASTAKSREQFDRDWETVRRWHLDGDCRRPEDDPIPALLSSRLKEEAADRRLKRVLLGMKDESDDLGPETLEEETEVMEGVWRWRATRDPKYLAPDAPETAARWAELLAPGWGESERERKERPIEWPPAITATGWPNLFPFSILLTGVAFFAFFFLPAEFAGKIVAFTIVWWLFILPVIVILTGFNTWQADPDEPAPKL